MPKGPVVVYCPYCGDKALLVDSSEVYRQSYGLIWICRPCDAYTGVHKSSQRFKPLGTLAKKELRELRQQVHKLFDPTWKKKLMSRNQAYKRLAHAMCISEDKCHIAMFSEINCRKAIRIMKDYWERK